MRFRLRSAICISKFLSVFAITDATSGRRRNEPENHRGFPLLTGSNVISCDNFSLSITFRGHVR